MDETTRRREMQEKYNREHGITPQTIVKAIHSSLESEVKARRTVQEAIRASEPEVDRTELLRLLEEEMLEAARNLEFERAAQLRDRIEEIKGAPLIERPPGATDSDPEVMKIWQPRNESRAQRRRK